MRFGLIGRSAAQDLLDVLSRAELGTLKAELRRLRREAGRGVARGRIQADPGPGDDAPTFARDELAAAWESVSDRLVRFPGTSWGTSVRSS
jgi:hypothetical protein